MVEQPALADTGAGRDRIQGEPGGAGLEDELLGGIEQRLAAIGFLPRHNARLYRPDGTVNETFDWVRNPVHAPPGGLLEMPKRSDRLDGFLECGGESAVSATRDSLAERGKV